MQGQSLEPLAGNASFLILQAPPMIEPSILKNLIKLVELSLLQAYCRLDFNDLQAPHIKSKAPQPLWGDGYR